jgi:hypothetical protein
MCGDFMKKHVAKKQTTGTPKTACINLKANGSAMSLVAVLRTDGMFETSVIVRDAQKKLSRGMRQVWPTMDAAKAHLLSLADQATKLGWLRPVRTYSPRPDAFAKLPHAPKAVA